MSEVKKIATRDSYGNALVELGKAHDDLIVLDADLAGATKTCIFQDLLHAARCLLSAHLPCLQQAETMTR